MEPFSIEKINGDNRRPGMNPEAQYIVRYRPHESFGWLCCRTFETLKEAKVFVSTNLDDKGSLK